ncbi:MAG: hypothetical protein ABI678_05440 [Kofleriaceae bacterium]
MRSEHEPNPNAFQARDYIFHDERLWAELESPNDTRRQSALALMDALADLSSLRAQRWGTNFLIERHNIFKMIPIEVDMEFGEPELRRAACRVFEQALILAALIEVERIPTSDAIRESAHALGTMARKRLAEMDVEDTRRQASNP